MSRGNGCVRSPLAAPGGAFGDLLGGAVRRDAGRPDKINLIIAALADLEDQHVMIMDVISAPPPGE